MKEVIDKFPKIINEVKQNSTNLLGFIGVMIFVLVLGIIGISSLSKLPLWCNLTIIGIFLLIFCYILLRTFNKAIVNPQLFIFNQNAFITVMREKLTDSDINNTYYSDELIERNSEVPKQIMEEGQNKDTE